MKLIYIDGQNITGIEYGDVVVVNETTALKVTSVFGSKANKLKYPDAEYFYGKERLIRLQKFLSTGDMSHLLKGDCGIVAVPDIDLEEANSLVDGIIESQETVLDVINKLGDKSMYLTL